MKSPGRGLSLKTSISNKITVGASSDWSESTEMGLMGESDRARMAGNHSTRENERRLHQAELARSAIRLWSAWQGPGYVRAIKDFDGSQEDHLSVDAGQVISVHETPHQSDWWKGQVADRVGWFPASHVRVLEPTARALPPRLPTRDSLAFPNMRTIHSGGVPYMEYYKTRGTYHGPYAPHAADGARRRPSAAAESHGILPRAIDALETFAKDLEAWTPASLQPILLGGGGESHPSMRTRTSHQPRGTSQHPHRLMGDAIVDSPRILDDDKHGDDESEDDGEDDDVILIGEAYPTSARVHRSLDGGTGWDDEDVTYGDGNGNGNGGGGAFSRASCCLMCCLPCGFLCSLLCIISVIAVTVLFSIVVLGNVTQLLLVSTLDPLSVVINDERAVLINHTLIHQLELGEETRLLTFSLLDQLQDPNRTVDISIGVRDSLRSMVSEDVAQSVVSDALGGIVNDRIEPIINGSATTMARDVVDRVFDRADPLMRDAATSMMVDTVNQAFDRLLAPDAVIRALTGVTVTDPMKVEFSGGLNANVDSDVSFWDFLNPFRSSSSSSISVPTTTFASPRDLVQQFDQIYDNVTAEMNQRRRRRRSRRRTEQNIGGE